MGNTLAPVELVQTSLNGGHKGDFFEFIGNLFQAFRSGILGQRFNHFKKLSFGHARTAFRVSAIRWRVNMEPKTTFRALIS